MLLNGMTFQMKFALPPHSHLLDASCKHTSSSKHILHNHSPFSDYFRGAETCYVPGHMRFAYGTVQAPWSLLLQRLSAIIGIGIDISVIALCSFAE